MWAKMSKKGLGFSQEIKLILSEWVLTRFACYSVKKQITSKIDFSQVSTHLLCLLRNSKLVLKELIGLDKNGKIKVKSFSVLDCELQKVEILLSDKNSEYRFTGVYDGTHSLSAKLLKNMANDKSFEKGADKE